jgi:diadenosine tetraphosphate (Ap4A) HIT family hydrolase
MNTSTLTPEQFERIAVRRVKAKMGWYFHAAIYVVVNIGLAAIAAFHGKHWHLFPLVGWGLGLAIHGAAVWFRSSIAGYEWRERMIAKERSMLSAQQKQQG